MLRHHSRFACATILLCVASIANAQITSSLQTIALTATKGQSVTLSVPSPTAQTVTLVDGQTNQYANPFTSTVGWDVVNASTTVKLVAYFTTPSQALVNGSDVIPSSLIKISIDGGATWNALNTGAVGGVGTSGGSLVLYTSGATTGANKKSNSTVTFLIEVDLSGNPGTSAGTYTGTLNLMAICN